MDKETERELLEFLAERRNRKAFFNFIKKPHIYLPAAIIVIILTEDPNLNLIMWIRHILKAIKEIF